MKTSKKSQASKREKPDAETRAAYQVGRAIAAVDAHKDLEPNAQADQ